MARKIAAGGGRPLVYATELPVYESMDQCHARTSVPLALLKLAKKSGCDAFRHGRVHFYEFIKWFFAQEMKKAGAVESDGDHSVDWVRRDKRAAALIKEVKLEEARELVIEFAVVDRFLTHLVNGSFFGELDRIKSEFPAALKGKGELDISDEVGRQIELVKSNLTKQLETWQEKKGKQ